MGNLRRESWVLDVRSLGPYFPGSGKLLKGLHQIRWVVGFRKLIKGQCSKQTRVEYRLCAVCFRRSGKTRGRKSWVISERNWEVLVASWTKEKRVKMTLEALSLAKDRSHVINWQKNSKGSLESSGNFQIASHGFFLKVTGPWRNFFFRCSVSTIHTL